MITPTASFSRFAAAACATVITAVSAWIFANSSASTARDPFHFAAVMAANAEIRAAQVAQERSRSNARACWNQSLSDGRPPSSSIPECRRG
jgi:predicted outer membrane protein